MQLTPDLTEEERLSRYGIAVAIQPLGQTIFGPILGYLNTKIGTRKIGLMSSIAYVIGNILYSILSVFPVSYRYPLLLTARFIVGACSGNVASVRSYIASATYVTERTSEMSIASAFQSVGFLIGPGIQAALTPLECTDVNTNSVSYFSFDLYTSAGWVCAILGAINFVLFLIFKEIDVSQKEREFAKKDTQTVQELPKPYALGVGACLAVFFIMMFNFIIVETLGTPMCIEQLGWTAEETILRFGLLTAGMGVVLLFGFVTVGRLCKLIDERKVMIFGILLMFLGRLSLFPIPGFPLPPMIENSTDVSSSLKAMARNIPCDDSVDQIQPGCELQWCKNIPAITIWQLFGGIIIGAIGHPYAISIAISLYSKIIGPRPQGTWMGLTLAVGGFARFLGPIFVSYIYTYYGTYLTSSLMVGSTVFAIASTTILYKKLVPLQIQVEETETRL